MGLFGDIKTKSMNKKINNNPTAHIAINKSRLKQYNKNSDIPVYYLNKSSEFQIELFNPTTDNILAKISLNNKPIAQGGLILRPGERVFLDRYIDVARKFKFDTYEVANTNEVKQAIKDNGDFKVEFFKEYIQPTINYSPDLWPINIDNTFGGPNIRGIGNHYYHANVTTNLANFKSTSDVIGEATLGLTNLSNTLDGMSFMDQELSREVKPSLKSRSKSLKSKKSIETGRVEMGSTSNQKMTTVNMNWEVLPFHTVEYKMLPVSQKVNTTQDLQVKRYCTNCGTKQKPSFKFCPSCGAKC